MPALQSVPEKLSVFTRNKHSQTNRNETRHFSNSRTIILHQRPKVEKGEVCGRRGTIPPPPFSPAFFSPDFLPPSLPPPSCAGSNRKRVQYFWRPNSQTRKRNTHMYIPKTKRDLVLVVYF